MKKRIWAMLILLTLFAAIFTNTKTLAATVGKVKWVSADVKNGVPVLTWKAVSGATGYRIYRKAEGAKKWTKVKNTKKTTLTDENISTTSGSIKYRIRAYTKNGNKTQWGKYSATKVITLNNNEKGIIRKTGTLYQDTASFYLNHSGDSEDYVYISQRIPYSYTYRSAIPFTDEWWFYTFYHIDFKDGTSFEALSSDDWKKAMDERGEDCLGWYNVSVDGIDLGFLYGLSDDIFWMTDYNVDFPAAMGNKAKAQIYYEEDDVQVRLSNLVLAEINYPLIEWNYDTFKGEPMDNPANSHFHIDIKYHGQPKKSLEEVIQLSIPSIDFAAEEPEYLLIYKHIWDGDEQRKEKISYDRAVQILSESGYYSE